MARPPDILVVGGGPAGAAAALVAARAGARVVLLERERFPRDKVCGEFVSAEVRPLLRRLGVEDALLAAGATRIESCRVSTRGGSSHDAALAQGLGVSRARLDATLLEAAAASGVDVREQCPVSAPLLDGGRVMGVRLRGEEEGGALRARVTVAADGRRSLFVRALHRRLGDPVRTTDRSWFGLKVHLEGEADLLGGRVELHLFDGGYAGLAAIEGARINVCMMVRAGALRACGGDPGRVLAERVLANPAARGALDGARACGRWLALGPLRFAPRRPAAAGALFAGDAAGTIDPFCGEGIAHALLAGEMAGRRAVEAAAAGGLDDAGERRAITDWRRAFAGPTRRARLWGLALGHPVVAAAILRAAGPSGFAGLVRSARTTAPPLELPS